MSQPEVCAVPLGPGRWCNATPAERRYSGALPTCAAHAHLLVGVADLQAGDAPLCDLCSATNPVVVYAASGFHMRGSTVFANLNSAPSWWAACATCQIAIDANDLAALEHRWTETHGPVLAAASSVAGPLGAQRVVDEVRAFHRGFLGSRDRARPAVPYAAWDGSLRP